MMCFGYQMQVLDGFLL